MSNTMTLVCQCRVNSENYLSGFVNLTGDDAQLISELVAANATANAVSCAPIDSANAVGYYFIADGNLSVNFVGPNLVVNMVANSPWSWSNDSGQVNPFGSTAVTAVEVDNASANTVNLTGRVLIA